MFVFTLITYLSLYLGLAFCALCLATGLYYLAELAEEYTVLTKKILRILFFTIVGVHIALLIFERFPFFTTLFGIITHVIYSQFLQTFPYFKIQSLTFVLSLCSFVINHILWYLYFTDYHSPTHDFYQLLGFFFSCVWLLPIGLFVTLSMDNLSLPGIQNLSGNDNDDIIKKKKSICSNLTSFFKK